jgi:hypothetical protein
MGSGEGGTLMRASAFPTAAGIHSDGEDKAA